MLKDSNGADCREASIDGPGNPKSRLALSSRILKNDFLPDVHQLMDNNIINDLGRRHDQTEAEGQMVVFRAGSPAPFGRCYPNVAGRKFKHVFEKSTRSLRYCRAFFLYQETR